MKVPASAEISAIAQQALLLNSGSLVYAAEYHIPAGIIGAGFPFFEQCTVALSAAGLPVQTDFFGCHADRLFIGAFDLNKVTDRGVVFKDPSLP